MLEPRSNFSVAILNGRLFVMGGDVEGSVCNMVDVYCSASNKFVPLLSFGQDVKMARSKADFESRWSRGSELVTARSALACLTVPRGDIF